MDMSIRNSLCSDDGRRSASPIIDVGRESPDPRLCSPAGDVPLYPRCRSADAHADHDDDSMNNNNDIDKPDSTSDISTKLSFGIHRILGGSPPPRTKDADDPIRELDYRTDHGGHSPLRALSPRLVPTLIPHPHFSPAFGAHVPRTLEFEHLGPGVIKVPAQRPLPTFPTQHLAFSPLMFPWMQERKDRLTSEFMLLQLTN